MTTIHAMFNGVAWEPVHPVYGTRPSDGTPYATHKGVLELMGHKLPCYRLSDGRAVFEGDAFEKFLIDWLGDDVNEVSK